MKSFNDTKQDLRELFMQKGWGQEIEEVTPEYYKVYITVLEFIKENFYTETGKEIATIRNKECYTTCNKCGRKSVYYRKRTNDYKCRKCEVIVK